MDAARSRYIASDLISGPPANRANDVKQGCAHQSIVAIRRRSPNQRQVKPAVGAEFKTSGRTSGSRAPGIGISWRVGPHGMGKRYIFPRSDKGCPRPGGLRKTSGSAVENVHEPVAPLHNLAPSVRPGLRRPLEVPGAENACAGTY